MITWPDLVVRLRFTCDRVVGTDMCDALLSALRAD